MSSPIFSMSLDVKPQYWMPPSKSTSCYNSRRSQPFDSRPQDSRNTIYIKGFPGYDVNGDSSDINSRFDHTVTGNSDLDDLVDRLQLDSNDTATTKDRRSTIGMHPRNNAPPHFDQLPPARKVAKSLSCPDSSQEIISLFTNIFHTQYCNMNKKVKGTPFTENLRRYFLMYMRNWEDVLECTRCEKQLISDFKFKHHEKLNRVEWNYFSSFFDKVDISSSNKAFNEFVAMLKTKSSTSLSSSPVQNTIQTSFGTSPTSISLHDSASSSSFTSLANSCSNLSHSLSRCSLEDADRIMNNSLPEVKRLYICIYYPNFREFWNSDVFILSTSLTNAIENFLVQYPSIDSNILSSLTAIMNPM